MQYLFSKFHDPARPQEDLLRDATADFTNAINETLKTDGHKNTVIRFRLSHDILRFLFNYKNLERLQLEDFETQSSFLMVGIKGCNSIMVNLVKQRILWTLH